ncbi:hypothetical protein RFZ03_14115, partial [Acinetobacter baumannii]|nr:hypothetical protein [Acinetobacter baumannii]
YIFHQAYKVKNIAAGVARKTLPPFAGAVDVKSGRAFSSGTATTHRTIKRIFAAVFVRHALHVLAQS